MGNVNLELYKTFYVVAKNLSMTKAAEELMISQPAISKSIKTLESQIGGTLFNRSSKGLELTNEGKMLFDRVSIAINLITSAENDFDTYKKLQKGEVRIGISSVLSKCLISDVIKNFSLKYPDIKINITNGLTDDLIRKMNEGKLDFVIYNNVSDKKYDANVKPLTKLSYSFFYNPSLYKVDKIKEISDLNNYCLILQQKGSNTRDMLDEYTENVLNPYIEVMSQDLICSLVNDGIGIGFAFDKIIEKNKDLKKIVFDTIDADINIATNKSVKPSFAARVFIKEIISKY